MNSSPKDNKFYHHVTMQSKFTFLFFCISFLHIRVVLFLP